MVKKPSPSATESEAKMTRPAKRAKLVAKEDSEMDVLTVGAPTGTKTATKRAKVVATEESDLDVGNLTIGTAGKGAAKRAKFEAKEGSTEVDLETPGVPKSNGATKRSARASTTLNSSKRTTKVATKLKIPPANDRGSGKLYTFGTNDCGQLGIVADKRKFPALVVDLEDILMSQVSAGSLHTVALAADGKVYTFGCNDECALGREGVKDGSEGEPEQIDFPHKVVQVTAGDCHSALLTEHGQVFGCGTFRSEDGQKYGLLPGDHPTIVPRPQRIYPHPDNHAKIVKIASGINHLVLLSEDGDIYTCGDNDLGQLGREALTRSSRSRQGTEPDDKEFLLTPSKVNIGKKVTDIWAGCKCTLVKTEPKGQIWGFGLNSSLQLGVHTMRVGEKLVKVPRHSKALDGKDWKEFSFGKDHTIALDTDGKVFVLGLGRDGQLGLLDDELPSGKLITSPTQLEVFSKPCVQVSAENTSSFAITKDLQVLGWGFGDNWQLGNGEDEDRLEPTLCVSARNAPGIDGNVTYVSAGFQHTAIIIASKEN